ncbi:MAG: PAS domain S-box-containing protein, partial [bacterium]
QSRDEIGDLVDTVNYMLNEIEARDQALVESRTRLELRVRQRTRDLARAKEAAELSAGSLRVSEERFRSLSTAAPLGIFQVDVAGRFVYCNPRLLEMFSAIREDVMGYGWSRRLNRADQRWLRSRWSSHDSSGWSREFELNLGELGIRWLHFAASPSDVAGSRAGTVADVTERRRAEAERETLNTQLREASRRAGMAEVATGVLHNVGNVLNSVNVSATFLHDRLKNSRAEAVGRLAQLVGEQPDFGTFATHDPRGQILPAYLNKLARLLHDERSELVQEVDGLRSHVDHIKQIVVMQQSLARAGGVTERCSPVDMVEEALGIDSESFRKHHIAVIRDFEDAPDVVVDRHKMLQILINLVSNAKHAIKEGAGKRELVAQLLWSDTDGLTVVIKDTGIGIGPENLARVFNHGFTSRRDGHGFGLHSSAIAAKEMGGSLVGESEGPGCGAVFTVKLPASIRADIHEDATV